MPICSDLDEVEERRRLIFTLDALLAIVTIELQKEARAAAPPAAAPLPGQTRQERQRREAAKKLARHFLRQAS